MSERVAEATSEYADRMVHGLDVDEICKVMLCRYYKDIGKDPDTVAFKYYKETSSIKRFGNPPVSGYWNIRCELARYSMKNVAEVLIWSIRCDKIHETRLSMEATGQYHFKSGGSRFFVQTVVYASQEYRSYYIHSDMIEWLNVLRPTSEFQEFESTVHLGLEPPTDWVDDKKSREPIPVNIAIFDEELTNDQRTETENQEQEDEVESLHAKPDDLLQEPRPDGLRLRKLLSSTTADDPTAGISKKNF